MPLWFSGGEGGLEKSIFGCKFFDTLYKLPSLYKKKKGYREKYHVFYASFINADVEGAGRGAIAREDLKVGDTALEIPASLIISEELVKKSDMV